MDDSRNTAAGTNASFIGALASWPRLRLGMYPTPIRELARLRQQLGCAPRLWIKHDDFSGPAFGGNKVRKLEYVLAQAVADSVDVILTTGGVTSNHARVTAGLCAQLGFACELVLNTPPGQPLGKQGRPASLFVDELFGARIHRVERPEDRTPTMERLAKEFRMNGKNPLVIPIGASTPLGALGFVDAARECLSQAKDLRLNLRAIFHATSSGGTQAGLIAGVRFAGGDGLRIIGVGVGDPADETKRTVHEILAGLQNLLGVTKEFGENSIEVDDRFGGAGYAIPSDRGSEAISLLAKTEGVILDPVYTAKAMAGFLDIARSRQYGKDDDLILWHTGGQLALFQEVIS